MLIIDFTSVSPDDVDDNIVIIRLLYQLSYDIFLSWGIGLGVFFAFTTITKYLSYHPEISVVLDMIVNSFPRIVVEAFGFIPILMGYHSFNIFII